MQNPGKTLGLAFYHYIKSVAFIALYVALCKYFLCKLKNLRGKMDGWNPALAASWATIALVLEPESRRQEITLFLVPKFLETAFRLLRKRGLARNVPGWELLVFGLAMGILNIFYQHEVNILINYVYIIYIKNRKAL